MKRTGTEQVDQFGAFLRQVCWQQGANFSQAFGCVDIVDL